MRRFKHALLLQFAALAASALFIGWIAHRYPLVHYLVRAQQKVGAMEFWGGVLYPLLYAACNVLLLPGGVLAIGSGLFFGLWWGFFLNLAGNVTGAAVSFFVSRKLGRGWVEKRFFRHRKWVALDEAIARDGWKIIFLSQVHPLFPSSLLNYLYGVTRIRFGTCMLWVALGQAPGLFLYAYLGTLTQLGLRLLRGKSHPQTIEYLVWIGGLVLTVVVTAVLGRIALRVLREVEAAANKSNPEPAKPRGVLEEAKS
ncbi:MAG: hypothetical protein QOE70_6674 [Chthoniobacter sp.]|jgi:uncharacterized membrane protein YdjX (TVP38/TMEM64 family)|nr:hypothetical protein [Chthoniobacter sp.]